MTICPWCAAEHKPPANAPNARACPTCYTNMLHRFIATTEWCLAEADRLATP